MAFVKAGHRYYYNNTSGALYPWSPDLEKVKGLTMFTAPRDGEFEAAMLQAGETAEEAPVAPKRGLVKTPPLKTVKYVAPAVDTVEVPVASGSATVPAVNLTSSDVPDA